MDEVKQMIAGLRGEGDTVTCARCGRDVPTAEAEPEEAGEWECRLCWQRCELQEVVDEIARAETVLRDENFGTGNTYLRLPLRLVERARALSRRNE